jgi:two-component system sensor histidine kinase BaeS
MPTAERRTATVRSSLAMRLTLAFVAVSVLAVLIVTGLAVILGGQGISAMVQERRADLTHSLAANAVATFNTGERPGWDDADWAPALDLAARNGTDVAVLDAAGRLVVATPNNPLDAPGAQRSPIEVSGRPVGTLVVSFNGRGLSQSADHLRHSLMSAVVGAAGLAALLALAVALAVSRRLAAPLLRLIASTEAMRDGARSVRVGPVPRAPQELRDLAATFDQMADDLARQERLRRELAADVAHELRTPIHALQVNLEALMDGVVPHTLEQTESLHEEVVRLAERVTDLQVLANADAAALALHVQSCDLDRIVVSAVDALPAGQDRSRVICDLAPTPVDADPSRLRQVITNVLVNACKFSPPDGEVLVQVRPAREGAQLRVTDQGPGIDPADLPRVFDRFWRGSRTAQVPGSGIGLTIVDQLVRAHHGSVRIESEPGCGTTVIVTLPLRRPVPVQA